MSHPISHPISLITITSHITHYTLHITHYTLHITHYSSQITRHISPITYHISYITHPTINHIASANKKRVAWGKSNHMEAIVILWILLFFSFLEAAINKSDSSTSQEKDMTTVWSKEEFLKCLESN